VKWKTPDDGQKNCPKHVEFYYKNKFEKLVHLVGFIIRIYHDARAPERTIACVTYKLTEWDLNPHIRHGTLVLQCYKKVKWSHYRPGVTQRVGNVWLYSSITAVLEGGEWSAARPGRTLPPGKTRYPFYRRLGWPHGRSGRAENRVPTGIRSRTVQPIVNPYTDWATRPTLQCYNVQNMR